MSGGYTISPVIQESEDGSEQIVDFSLSGHQGYDSNSERMGGNQNDYVIDNQGQAHHVFEDAELESESEEDRSGFEEFGNAVHAAYPDLHAAQVWAAQNLSEEDITAFDNLVDTDDNDAIYRAVETLVSLYQNASQGQPQQPQQQRQGGVDLDHYFEMSEDPSLTAQKLEDLSKQYLQEGDQIGAYFSAGLSSFHDGDLSRDEVIGAIVSEFGKEEVLDWIKISI